MPEPFPEHMASIRENEYPAWVTVYVFQASN